MTQLVLGVQVVEAGHRQYRQEQEGLCVSQLAGSQVRRDDYKGEVRHHVRLVHFHQCLCLLDRDNVFVDNVAILLGRSGSTGRGTGRANGCIFLGKRLLDDGPRSLQAEEVLDLLLESLYAPGGQSVRGHGWAAGGVRVAFGRVIAPSRWPEDALFAQSCTPAAISLGRRVAAVVPTCRRCPAAGSGRI